jgi:hypothetical protein
MYASNAAWPVVKMLNLSKEPISGEGILPKIGYLGVRKIPTPQIAEFLATVFQRALRQDFFAFPKLLRIVTNVLATDTHCILAFVIVLRLAKNTKPSVKEKERIVCTRWVPGRRHGFRKPARCAGLFHNWPLGHVSFLPSSLSSGKKRLMRSRLQVRLNCCSAYASQRLPMI